MTVLAEAAVTRRHEARSPGSLLRDCEGYRVDFVDGRLGYVEGVMCRHGESEPSAFEVRTPFGFVVLDVQRVIEVLPGNERVIVEH